MAKAKYIRVSTTHQNTDRQEVNTDDVKLFTDQISGSVKFQDRPQGKKLIKAIEKKEIDHVIVHAIDRLGRNQIDVLQTIQFFKDQKCNLTIQNLGIDLFLDDKKENPIFGIISSVISCFAEKERTDMLERQKEGIAIAKAKGVYVGRKVGSVDDKKKVLQKHSDIVKCHSKKMSIRDTATVTKKSKSTVQKVYDILNGKGA